MVKELYQIHTREITLNITSNQVDSVRKKNIVKSGCRVYEGGCIGVAGTLGQPTEETWQAAADALALGIACPKGPTTDLQRTRTVGEMPEEKTFIAQTEAILAKLKEEFPRFILSNKMKAVETTVTMENDAGLRLEEKRCEITCAMVVKDETSPNVFDSFITYQESVLDEAALLDIGRQVLSAHANLIPMPQESLPVVMDMGQLYGALSKALNGSNLHKGASLFSSKVGQKLFDEKFSLVINREEKSGSRFFDAEGTTLPGDRLPLIENGVLLRGTADKKAADEFGAELTASAAADYDDAPQLGSAAMDVVPTGTLAEILGDQDAIFVHTASGGDTTPAGDFATPVQTAYLLRGGRFVARLPEFSFSGSIFDLLGSGYLGCLKEELQSSRQLVLKGTIR